MEAVQAPSEYLNKELCDFDPKRSMIFGSNEKALVTHGIFARIEAPARNGENPRSRIQRQITRAFAEAKDSGIEKPVVVGSIPFDTSKPSCLIVPQCHRWIDLSGAYIPAPPAPHALQSYFPRDNQNHGREAFQNAVRELIQMFESGPIKKVVLSSMLDVPVGGNLAIGDVIHKILLATVSGYRFAIPVHDEGTLVGASPELLVRKTGSAIVSNPLAGSIGRFQFGDESLAEEHLQNSAKDRYEHSLVVEQVRQVLELFCSKLNVPPTPSLLQTPTLWHLSTLIKGSLNRLSTNSLALACALHPTPAVCGFPRGLARQAIRQFEAFDRDLFTGMTGWMDHNGNGEWAVTIRCGIVKKNHVRVFAGAGIVPGSDPEREWAEISAKLAPMLWTLGMIPKEARP